ncbi:hypothetical protein [Nicoliella lavandulae]|uniref:5-bromo-4-chloroindolyl phosphate hydrolysis protein n=1 Tax=Nicoliella lavandulae TaxID=3082954 RepID=A0ABU8SMN4_9LACO
MIEKLKKLLMNIVMYVGIFVLFILAPLFILHLIYPMEKSADVWITFLGSYLGSIVAVIGTVIVTRMQIKTERLDSLNNSLFIERYQMLNSLLSDLYRIKNDTLDYSRKVKVIKRYIKNNNKIEGIKRYTQNFLDDFDVDQFASFYNYSKNRLMSMDLSESDYNNIDQIITNLFNDNKKLLMTYRDLSSTFRQKGDEPKEDIDLDSMIDSLSLEGQNLRITIKHLDQLDQDIQQIIKDSRDTIIR